MSNKIKLLIVDDSSFMRNILNRLVEKDGRFEVVGKAKDGAEGVEMAKTLKPDVITLDIEMPVMTGIEALKVIMKECPIPIIMVSALTKEGAKSTLEAMEHGAVDFIPKSMEAGGASMLKNSNVLMDKIYTAASARIGISHVRPLPIARETEKKVVKSTSSASTIRKPARIGLPGSKIMIIGSSTGGPRALQDILPKLPSTLKVPIVIAQHMPQHFTSPMAERLNSLSNLNIVEGKDGDILKAGSVYIAPGGVHTRVKSHGTGFVLCVKEDTGKECVYRPSVDILASSAAKNISGPTLALMLTGMGSDGAEGFNELKNKNGYILAQDEETSVVYGMPKSVASVADEVLPLENVVSAIVRLIG